MGFEERQSTKELILKKLNGKLRLALWGLVALGVFSSLGALIWWRQSTTRLTRAEESQNKMRETIVGAIVASDSLEAVRHNEEMKLLEKIYEEVSGRNIRLPAEKQLDKEQLNDQLKREAK